MNVLEGQQGLIFPEQGKSSLHGNMRGEKVMITVAVPVEAEIYLPDGRMEKVSAGEYSYEVNKA